MIPKCIKNKILNQKTTSETDAYSCSYINNITSQGGYGTKISRFSSSTVSTASTNFKDIGAQPVTLDVKKDKSTVLIFAKAGGIYSSNLGYEVFFDMIMDNNTYSTSGPKAFLSADYRGNITSDGSLKVPFFDMFVFTNVPKGNHNFTLCWKTQDGISTAYSGYYASVSLTAIEL